MGIFGEFTPKFLKIRGRGQGGVFKGFGDILGTKSDKYWGILGRNSLKIFEFQGGDRDNNFGEFANSNSD